MMSDMQCKLACMMWSCTVAGVEIGGESEAPLWQSQFNGWLLLKQKPYHLNMGSLLWTAQ